MGRVWFWAFTALWVSGGVLAIVRVWQIVSPVDLIVAIGACWMIGCGIVLVLLDDLTNRGAQP